MKLKHLKSILDDVDTFDSPNVQLEQYPTPPDIAAHMLHHIYSQGEVEEKVVADLGCGCGILSVAAAVLNASYVVGFDIDMDALEICARNCKEMELTTVDMVQVDITAPFDSRWSKAFDTVVMNPPFGTRNKGLDMLFLKVALQLSSGSVYSLHKSSTREHIKKKAAELNLTFKVVAELRYNLDKTYSFHKRDSKDIAVDFVHFSKKT
ncbi:rRNA N6-adenosine-methyltransferase METTL5-like isoform X2 [Ornithodoros turicata]|uniref:Methyltransferase-like protein 5 n=3 Tax=Ornithodoros turicata TaxID=34597 RepID=A0A2R5L499_9ACAR